MVHRNGFGLNADFSLLTISIPDAIKKNEIDGIDLPIGWNGNDERSQLHCQKVGDNWLRNQQSAVLIVPSAIIINEKNVLINPTHPHFIKIKIKSVQIFNFDKRLV